MKKLMANKKKWGIGIFLLLLIAVLIFSFVKHYHMLGQTIESERSTYISEIRNQLVKSINDEKEQQITLVTLYGQILAQFEPQYFEDISSLLSYDESRETGDEVFLADTSGNVYTSDGEQRRLSAKDLIYDLTVEGKDVFGYSQINEQEEFWIYGAPVQEMTVEGVKICAVINARSVDNFSKRMSTGIISNSGYLYIMSKTGNVLVFPAIENPMGYNFFNTLEGYGIDESIISKIKNDFKDAKENAQVLSFDDNKWLLNYSGDLYDDWVVVVMMPMTITGADTYKMLNETTILLLLLFTGIIGFILFIIRIFYQRERLRERLIQEEKANLLVAQKIAESKNSFLAKMSHDIRTPLNAIIGLLQITADSVSDRPKAYANLSQAGKSAEYLLNVLNDILDMSKIESGKMKIRKAPFSIYELMDTLRTINIAQASAKQIDFDVRTAGTLSEYYIGDKVRISQIMMNLLSNAIKFTGRSGHIQFTLKAESESAATDILTFTVQDDGIGMSKEYMNRLFEPFEQAEETQNLNIAGSGLGLSIVKNLVELMNGSIDVTSEKGRGSCFTVILTLEKTAKPEEETEEELADICLEGRKALLVEDNELNALIAEEILVTMCHMSVKTVPNGLEAVKLFQDSPAGEYDLILMDIRMPVMNGLEAAREIRNLPHPDAETIPIVAMSANAFDEDIAAAYASGMNDYLSKPVDVHQIITVIKKCCRKSRENYEN